MEWVSFKTKRPDPLSELRVLVFTPNNDPSIRYRLMPAQLVKQVCTDATHWIYVADPTD